MALRKSVYLPSALSLSAFSARRLLSTSQTASTVPNFAATVASYVPIPPQPIKRTPGRSLGDLSSSAAACASVSSTNQLGSASDPAMAAVDLRNVRRFVLDDSFVIGRAPQKMTGRSGTGTSLIRRQVISVS